MPRNFRTGPLVNFLHTSCKPVLSLKALLSKLDVPLINVTRDPSCDISRDSPDVFVHGLSLCFRFGNLAKEKAKDMVKHDSKKDKDDAIPAGLLKNVDSK